MNLPTPLTNKYFGQRDVEPRARRTVFISILLIWLSLIGIGMSLLWSYASTAGTLAMPPARWPRASSINPSLGKYTLVMLTHPQCPCSRASLEELDKLMANCQGRLDAYVVIWKPSGATDDWVKTSLWRRASAIPGVRVVIDLEGAEANRFHAATSGQVVLYGPDGRLLFNGGITASRGHAGDNFGESAIESLANTGTANQDRGPVFGCPLFDPDSECRKGGPHEVGN